MCLYRLAFVLALLLPISWAPALPRPQDKPRLNAADR
jgi:hypothetical protein